MLYLVHPDRTVRCIDLPLKTSELEQPEFQRPDADLADLDWQPADHPATDDVVRLALRYGLPCRTGLIVDAIVLINGREPEKFRALLRDAITRHATERDTMAPLFESIMPGWTEQGRELDARAHESIQVAVDRAQSRAEKQLAAPVRESAATHWRTIGGSDPDDSI